MELWDIFDRVREPQNRTAVRGSTISKQDFHLIIHAWVRRKSDGKLLVSRRVPQIFWGGYWQPTGGSVKAGESSKAAALRELNEELGIKADDAQSTLLFSYRFVPPEPENPSFFLDCWLFEFDDVSGKPQLMPVLQPEEVCEAKWCTLEEVLNLWQKGSFMPFETTWPPYFDVLKKSLQKPGTVFALRAWGAAELRSASTATPELDSSLLLAHVLGCQKNELLLRAEDKISAEDTAAFAKLLFKRADGMPVAYLTGHKDFWKSTFEVSPAVLIPKPDTELLVELAAKHVSDFFKLNPEKTLRLADVCTGSGCIGISVLQEALEQNLPLEKLKFTLTDISKDALDVAKRNAATILGNNVQNISFVFGDLLEPLLSGSGKAQTDGSSDSAAKFDLILSNPPYVPSRITDELLQDGRSEPRLALDGGADGLDIIRKLIPEVWQALDKNGILLIETGEYNAAETAALLKEAGFADVQTFDDLGGQPRVTQARKP